MRNICPLTPPPKMHTTCCTGWNSFQIWKIILKTSPSDKKINLIYYTGVQDFSLKFKCLFKYTGVQDFSLDFLAQQKLLGLVLKTWYKFCTSIPWHKIEVQYQNKFGNLGGQEFLKFVRPRLLAPRTIRATAIYTVHALHTHTQTVRHTQP